MATVKRGSKNVSLDALDKMEMIPVSCMEPEMEPKKKHVKEKIKKKHVPKVVKKKRHKKQSNA